MCDQLQRLETFPRRRETLSDQLQTRETLNDKKNPRPFLVEDLSYPSIPLSPHP